MFNLIGNVNAYLRRNNFEDNREREGERETVKNISKIRVQRKVKRIDYVIKEEGERVND